VTAREQIRPHALVALVTKDQGEHVARFYSTGRLLLTFRGNEEFIRGTCEAARFAWDQISARAKNASAEVHT